MVETKIIDGKAAAATLREEIARKTERLKAEKNITPGLAAIRVGNDPASEVYVRNKVKFAKEAGMNSWEFQMPETTTQAELLHKIDALNNDPAVHGILVQLPLPKHIDKETILRAVDPMKDVDGFHPDNVARLERGEEGFVPCTPLGCLRLLKSIVTSDEWRVVSKKNDTTSLVTHHSSLATLSAVVMGRSHIVGKPMAELLRKEGCEVKVIHSQTSPEDRARWLKAADIVVVAVGKPNILSGKEIKQGAVVIDVGINRLPPLTSPPQAGGTKGGRLIGDVNFESCLGIASAITPVPGGVGPMTIACLLENTYRAAAAQKEKAHAPRTAPQR